MKWEIKRGLWKDTLLDECGKTSAVIRLKRGIRLVTDPLGRGVYRCVPLSADSIGLYGAPGGTATLRFGEAAGPFVPPRAESASVTLGDETFSLCQTAGRSFTVSKGNDRFGSISGMFRRRIRLDLTAPVTADTAAVLYAVARTMFLADEIETV